MEAELSDWLSVRRRLVDMIQHAAGVCQREGRLENSSDEWQQKYTQSG